MDHEARGRTERGDAPWAKGGKVRATKFRRVSSFLKESTSEDLGATSGPPLTFSFLKPLFLSRPPPPPARSHPPFSPRPTTKKTGWTAEGPPGASCYGSPDAGAGSPFPWTGTGTGPPPPHAPSPGPSAAAAAAPARGRAVADAHLAACLAAGLAVTGCRAERASGQWSFSLGPLPPLEAADQLWAARWLLRAVAGSAEHRLAAVADALPPHLAAFEGRWDGNGCRVKFSTRATRDAAPGGAGRRALRDAIGRLAAAHASHMIAYGAGAALRCERAAAKGDAGGGAALPSAPPAASFAPPSPPWASPAPPALQQQQQQQQQPRFAGVEDPGALLRIPAAVALHGRGHLEDRRPAGGCDPYLTFTLLLCTTLGLPLPLPGGGDSPSLPGGAAAALPLERLAAAKRARCGGEQQQEEGEEAALLVACRRQLAPLASAAASGSGENLCPNANANANANQNINRNAAAASLLACDEQFAESAQDGEGDEEDSGGAVAAAATAPVENCDLDSDDDSDDNDDGGARSSALLLADGDEEDLVSTPLTPTRDAADGGATTVAGPDNREASSSPKRRRSSDLDDDASSSGGT